MLAGREGVEAVPPPRWWLLGNAKRTAFSMAMRDGSKGKNGEGKKGENGEEEEMDRKNWEKEV